LRLNGWRIVRELDLSQAAVRGNLRRAGPSGLIDFARPLFCVFQWCKVSLQHQLKFACSNLSVFRGAVQRQWQQSRKKRLARLNNARNALHQLCMQRVDACGIVRRRMRLMPFPSSSAAIP
jgi:hypothetical protein